MDEPRRRLAAIMFTDVEGYTALAQKDESKALDLIETHRKLMRPVILSYAGHEVKTMGDAFLIEFESALQALECAVELQKTIRDYNESANHKLNVRVGIHVGDVVHKGNDVYGDAVNIASRIEPLAVGGGICISGQVYYQVRNKVTQKLTRIDPGPLKNVSIETEVYRIVLPWEERRKSESGETNRRRLAVLPFDNISPDPSDEYFAEGLTEELIATLSRVQGLETIARTSVLRYKGGAKQIDVIGEELSVGAILEGSVRKAGNRIRVTAQLIDVRNQSHIWSDIYDRELNDVFAIQSDLAKSIVGALQVRILAEDKKRIEESPTANVEAYTLYLKGRHQWNKRSREGLERALEYFWLALDSDPDYALAYVGVADCYSILGGFGYMETVSAHEKAKEAAIKAIELDDTLGEAHLSLAWTLMQDWEWDQSKREFRRALELSPNDTTAHRWHGHFLFFVGRNEQGMAEFDRALQLDPKAPLVSLNIAEGLFILGEYDRAIQQYLKTLEIDASHVPTLLSFVFALAERGMFSEAIGVQRTLVKLDFPDARNHLFMAYIHAKQGKEAEARKILSQTKEGPTTGFIPPEEFAAVYAALGDRDKAFELLANAIAMHSEGLVALKYSPRFDSLRSDPRYNSLLRKMNLDRYRKV